MVQETRKFGVGMVLVGQSFEHLSNDLLTSASVRLVLGCPEMFLEQTRRRLGLAMVEQDKRKINSLSTIRPRQTAFAGVTMAGVTMAGENGAGENGAINAVRLARPGSLE